MALADDVDTVDEQATNELPNDEAQFSGVVGSAPPEPERPRWPSLDVAVEALEFYFQRSHGLSVDKAMVEEFIAYYRSHAFTIKD